MVCNATPRKQACLQRVSIDQSFERYASFRCICRCNAAVVPSTQAQTSAPMARGKMLHVLGIVAQEHKECDRFEGNREVRTNLLKLPLVARPTQLFYYVRGAWISVSIFYRCVSINSPVLPVSQTSYSSEHITQLAVPPGQPSGSEGRTLPRIL